ATLLCALERRESRGAHNRSDFPALDPAMQRNIYVRLERREAPLTIWNEAVPGLPENLKAALTDDELPVAGRLLEETRTIPSPAWQFPPTLAGEGPRGGRRNVGRN